MSLTSVYLAPPDSPPETFSDNERACGKCGYFIDLDEEKFTDMEDGSVRCEECREMCSGYCGEWLTGKLILLRCPTTGKREPWCLKCAADDWLDRLLEFRSAALEDFDPLSAMHVRGIQPDTLTKEAIDALWEFYRRPR